MKKIIWCLVFLGTFVAFASSSQAVTQAVNKERGFINIGTSAKAEVAPDVAQVSFTIKTSDAKSMQKATLENKIVSDKVYTLLKSMINSANEDYIKTTDFHASPIYIYTGSKKVLSKYEVSNRVLVKTKSLDKLGTMIDKAITAGATNVDSLSFYVSDYDSQCNKLIEQASQKARTRASIAAKSMMSTLDGIKSMDMTCSDSSSSYRPRLYMAKNMVAAGEDAVENSVDISSGTVKIQANVNVSFFVK